MHPGRIPAVDDIRCRGNAAMRPAIPDDVRRFILEAIPSVPYLEALLLMRGAGPVGWDIPALAAALYLDEQAAAELMQQLQGAAMIVADASSVRYAPAAPLAAIIDRLAAVYADNLIGVSMLIHSAGARRARNEAFRVR